MLTTAPVGAGGSWLDPTWVRVEAGDHIELSGEVSPGQLGWVADGPYFAYLSGSTYGLTLQEGLGGNKTDVPLGELNIEASGNWAQVSIAFTLPDDVPPGEYWVNACNDPCEQGFGDLIGSILYIGMDPPEVDDGPEEPAPTATTVAVAPVTTSTVATIAVDGSTAEPTVTYLSLAPYPTRPTGLKVAWIAISAAIAVAALGIIDLARRGMRTDRRN